MSIAIGLIGGLGLFLYGMNIMASGLENLLEIVLKEL